VALSQGKPTDWVAAGVIITIWLFLAALAIIIMVQIIND